MQRGHNRRRVFADAPDYRYYLNNLASAKAELKIRVLAYCLMTNHVHLVLVPGEDVTTVSQLMRLLAARQTRRVNRLANRTGTLWEGRFKASLVDTDQYLLACCRYVDLNPVRAAMVTAPEEYAWSGFRGRAGLATDPVLDEHSIFLSLAPSLAEQGPFYHRFVSAGSNDDELSLIRQAVQRNQLTGDSTFRSNIEARTGRVISARPPGRPRGK